MKNWILISIFAATTILQSCETVTGRSSTQRQIEGIWNGTDVRLETVGTASPEDQMIIAMINGMIKEMAQNMSITFYKDGDYEMEIFGVKTLGKYDLRADNTLLTLKEEGTTNAEKVIAQLEDNNGQSEILLEFKNELLEDPNFQAMLNELDSEIKMSFRFTKQ